MYLSEDKSEIKDNGFGWRGFCMRCGYTVDSLSCLNKDWGDEYTCPVCGHDDIDFEAKKERPW